MNSHSRANLWTPLDPHGPSGPSGPSGPYWTLWTPLDPEGPEGPDWVSYGILGPPVTWESRGSRVQGVQGGVQGRPRGPEGPWGSRGSPGGVQMGSRGSRGRPARGVQGTGLVPGPLFSGSRDPYGRESMVRGVGSHRNFKIVKGGLVCVKDTADRTNYHPRWLPCIP